MGDKQSKPTKTSSKLQPPRAQNALPRTKLDMATPTRADIPTSRAGQPPLEGSQSSKTKVKTPTTKAKPSRRPAKSIFWDLHLYIAGRTDKSVAALDHLKLLCEERFKGQYRLVVIDLLQHPELAKADQIVAIPTLVRKLPPPIKKIIGDLSNTQRVLVGLDLNPRTDK